ncbi:Similar to rdx: Protein roadkill (Drosophila melanogaster) [Cotesia congregata]|uniref:Similar to rdx: Protein roadkill (Drosophila melanogaster) n=1 Tax=Cotesia congregata TaxID=51543 RepID=A0A8J2HKS1_COTCN|nr:Similar to rdx: Protein roadkill (Drosophila melanogaster) [Cotesia congregata]
MASLTTGVSEPTIISPTKFEPKFRFNFELKLTEEQKWVDKHPFDMPHNAPGVEFTITAEFNKETSKLDLKISKNITEIAIAIVEITIPGMESLIKDVSKWKNNICFDGIPIPFYFDICSKVNNFCDLNESSEHKYCVPISCSVIWYGFLYEFRDSDSYYTKLREKYNKDSSDIIIKVEDTKFCSHRFLLSKTSPIFKELLLSDINTEDNSVHIQDVDAEVMRELLSFLYYGRLKNAVKDRNLTLKVFKAASLYKLSKLVNVCALLLTNDLTKDNVNIDILLRPKKMVYGFKGSKGLKTLKQDNTNQTNHTNGTQDKREKLTNMTEVTEGASPLTKFSFNCELELTKQDGWVDSEIFHTDSVPGVDFKISAYINYRSTHMNVKITKSEPGAATAIAEMTIFDMPLILRDITGWTDTYYFNELPLAIHSDKCPKKDTHCDPSSLGEHKYSAKINCSITWLGFTDDDYYSSSVYNDVIKFCRKESSDVILKVDEIDFLAHKILLRTESEVFQKILDADLEEKCICLSDLEIDVIQELLAFLYNGKLKASTNEELAVRLFKTACVYKFSKLKNVCALILSNKLTLDNALMMVKIGTLYSSSLLRERAITFLKTHKLEILKSNDILTQLTLEYNVVYKKKFNKFL